MQELGRYGFDVTQLADRQKGYKKQLYVSWRLQRVRSAREMVLF